MAFGWADVAKLQAVPFLQCFLCQYNVHAARLARLALLPIALALAYDYSKTAYFAPREGQALAQESLSFHTDCERRPGATKFCHYRCRRRTSSDMSSPGLTYFRKVYSAMKSIEWALAPCSDFVYTGPNPPSNALSWALELFGSMRGIHWKWGTVQGKLPAPLTSHIPTYLRQWFARLVAYHVLTLAGSIPVLEAAHVGSMSLLLRQHFPSLTPIEPIAWLLQGFCFGITVQVHALSGQSPLKSSQLGRARHRHGSLGHPLLSSAPNRPRPRLDQAALRRCRVSAPTAQRLLFAEPSRLLGLPVACPLHSWSRKDIEPQRLIVCSAASSFWASSLGNGSVDSSEAGHSAMRLAFFSASQCLDVSGLGRDCAALIAVIVMHEYGLWRAVPHLQFDWTFVTTRFFILQGLGMIAEHLFIRSTGFRVKGILGSVWTWTFVIWTGSTLTATW
jgi:hypothetical protein